MTNARRSIFSGLMILAAGAAVISSLLLIAPGNSVEGQATDPNIINGQSAIRQNAPPARNLEQITVAARVDNCSKVVNNVAQPLCTNAELVLFHPLSGLAVGDRTDEEDPGFDFTGDNADDFTYNVRQVGVAPFNAANNTGVRPTARNIDLTAASGSLYAAVRNQTNIAEGTTTVSSRNVIRYGADVVGIAVYDVDASSRHTVVFSDDDRGSSAEIPTGIGGAGNAGTAVMIANAGSITLNVPFDHVIAGSPVLPILDANGDGSLNGRDFTVTANRTAGDDTTAVSAADLRANIFVSVTSPGDPDNRGNALFTVTSALTYTIHDVTVSWSTAGASNTVPVQVATGATASSERLFLNLREARRGSSVFVGEVQLVPSGVAEYRTQYTTQRGITTSGAVINETHSATTRTVSATSGRWTRVVGDVMDGSAIRAIIPARPSDTLRVTYRDKVGVSDDDQATNQFENISQSVTVEAAAPMITITGPANDSATNLRRPTFSGTAFDQAGGSGLDVSDLRLFVPDSDSGNDVVRGYSLFEGDSGQTRVYFAGVDQFNATPKQVETARGMNTPRSRAVSAYDSGRAPLISADGYFNFAPLETAAVSLVDKGSLFEIPNTDSTVNMGMPLAENMDDATIGRLLGGSVDENTGLYSRAFNDGATVTWSYTPGEQGNLLSAVGDETLDVQVEYQVFAFDLAGNVGLIDVDPENDKGIEESVLEDFDNPSFNLDRKVPALEPDSSGIAYGNSDVRWSGSLQTGVNWDSSSGDLVVSRNHIAVTFDDEISLPPASAFTITWDPGFNGTITNVIAGPSDVDADGLDEGDSQISADRRMAIVEQLERTVFLEISADIPSSQTPQIAVANVQDTAGNTIANNDAATVENIEDGLGPEVTISFNGGSGVGEDSAGEGPGTLTNSQINIMVMTNEPAGVQPTVTITDENGNVTNDRATVLPEGSNDQGGDNFRVLFTRNASSNAVGRDRCVEIIVQDNANNSTSVGARGDFEEGNEMRDRKCRDTDGAQFFAVDPTPPSVARTERQEVFTQTPRIQLILSEEVQRDSVELWVNGDRVADDVLTANLSSANNRDFVYQVPAASPLRFGLSTFQIRATDLAANRSGMLPVTVRVNQPGELEVSLNRGWNLISFPSNPIEAGVGDVFDDDAILAVSTFDAANFRAGEQTADRNAITGNFTGELTTIRTGLAYWVFADSVANLEIVLEGPSAPTEGLVPTATTIRTIPGYNLVGIVDNARARTQGVANSTFYLQRAGDNVTVDQYFTNVATQRILRYDSAANRFVDVDRNVTTEYVRIGEGLLVYIQPLPNGSTPTITP